MADLWTRIADAINRDIIRMDNGLYLITYNHGDEETEVIPIHFAMSGRESDDIVGIISVKRGAVDEARLAWQYAAIRDKLHMYNGPGDDWDISPAVGAEVRRDGNYWTVTGTVPLWSRESRTEARRIAGGTVSAVMDIPVRKWGHTLGLGAGSGTLLRMIGAEIGDQIMVAVFKKT